MLVILSLYFFRREKLIFIVPILFVLAFIIPDLDYVPAKRTLNISEATLSGDVESVSQADSSGSFRVLPVLNAFKLDFTDTSTWLGYGTDYAKNSGDRDWATIWTDRGVISYFIGLILVFTCAIRSPISVMSLIFLLGCREVSNIYYIWGMLMIFTCVSYFEKRCKYLPTVSPEAEL